MTNKKTENDKFRIIMEGSCKCLTNYGKNSINRQNVESFLTLSETGGKLTLIELSIAKKMHCYSRHVLLTEQVRGN